MRERNVVGSWWVVVRVNIGLRLESALIALYFFYHGDGTNQQGDQYEGWSQEDDACRRSSHNSRAKKNYRK